MQPSVYLTRAAIPRQPLHTFAARLRPNGKKDGIHGFRYEPRLEVRTRKQPGRLGAAPGRDSDLAKSDLIYFTLNVALVSFSSHGLVSRLLSSAVKSPWTPSGTSHVAA